MTAAEKIDPYLVAVEMRDETVQAFNLHPYKPLLGPTEPPDGDWLIYFVSGYMDLFHRDRCGYWLCGIAFNPDIGTLAQIDPGDGELEVAEEIQRQWDAAEVSAANFPVFPYAVGGPCFHVPMYLEFAVRAWIEGVKLYGAEAMRGGDGDQLDNAVQMAVFGEIVYA